MVLLYLAQDIAQFILPPPPIQKDALDKHKKPDAVSAHFKKSLDKRMPLSTRRCEVLDVDELSKCWMGAGRRRCA